LPSSARTKPELLAPAGGPEALRAAVANGADAVYLGVDRLNARRSAENFTLENLSETCRYAHVRGVRIYLTVNVVVLQGELEDALGLVDEAWAAGVDAVIIQDLGLLRAVRSALPHVRVHSSTQLNAHNTPTIRTLAGLGVARVTLSREVSLDEIRGFVDAHALEIESFVHGALCMCYSGQCLMSSLIGRRSANRGQCAQPCRLPYELVDDARELLATPGAHLLSPKDLAGISVLGRLVESGVSALKIEGRMKSAEYVALVTGVYRSALDRAFADPADYAVRDGELSVLAESFSRGFTEAYLLGERGNEMMSYRRPNNRGVLIGRVTKTEPGRATIALESELDAEDTIEFWTSAGRFAQAAGPMQYEGAEHVRAAGGTKVTVLTEQTASVGDRVFRVRNAALVSAARRTFADSASDAATIALDFTVRVVQGRELRVEVSDSLGRAGSAKGPVVESARTKAVTADEIAEHIGRLGGTPYRIDGFDLELSPGSGIGFSALHRVRREALEAYERVLLEPWSTREAVHARFPRVERRTQRASGRPDIVVETVDLSTALECLQAGATSAHVPTHALRASDVPDGVVPLVPRILHDREVAAALAFAQAGRAIAIGNLGLVGPASAAGARVEAHWSLNALNALSIEQLVDLGADTVWLSPELSGRQIAELCAVSAARLGVGVWGRQEVMVTEHCILMAGGECDRKCGACTRRSARRFLRDRKGYVFPVATDITGRSHLYNSVVLDLTSALPEIVQAGVRAVRLDVHTESTHDAVGAVRAISRALDAVLAGREPTFTDRKGPTTSGHFFRGVT